jgi:O-antigen/teichoic acid export membrane protein
MTPAVAKAARDASLPSASMRSVARLRALLPRGEFFRASVTIVAGTGVAQLVTIVASPVLTRIYSPSEYGIYSVAVAILILSVATCLRYEFAIPLPKDDVAAANLVGLSLLANLGMSAATGVILLLFGPWLLSLFGASVLGPYIGLLALAQAATGFVSAFTNWAIRTRNFSEIAVNRIYQSGSLVGLQIGLGLVGFGAPGLLLGAVGGSLAGSVRLARAAWRTHAEAFRRVTWAGIRAAAIRYRRFPIFSSWSALIGQLGLRSPLLLLVVFYGTDVGGQYALAERLCYLPLTLVASSVGQVFISEGARLVREQPGELHGLFRRTTWNLARVGLGPAIILAVAAPFLTGPVFGEEWQQAGLFVAIMVPMFYFSFVLTSTGDVLYVVERQGLHLMREILRITLLGGSVLVAGAMRLSPASTVAALSAAGCLMYLLYGAISWWAITTYRPHPQLAPHADTDLVVERPEAGW